MKQKLPIILVLVFIASVVAFPAMAACDANSTVLCNPLDADNLEDLVYGIATFIRNLGLYAIAPLMVVIGGFQILTAGGNPENVSKGGNTIKWALIGVVILLVAWGLVGLIADILGVQQ